MSKKIIAAILIPAFLVQVVGCYSQNEITFNELKSHEKDEMKIITKDANEYSLNYDSKSGESNWAINDNNINITSKKLVKYSSNSLLVEVDTLKVPLSSVENIYYKYFNGLNTTYLILGIVGAYISIIALVLLLDEDAIFQ